jgi:hypothetical protein
VRDECGCVCACVSLVLSQAAGLMAHFPWSKASSRPPAALMGQVTPPPRAPSRSPFGFPCIVHSLVPRGNGAAAGCGGGSQQPHPFPPIVTPGLGPYPCCYSKNSPVHREPGLPTREPPAGAGVARTELSWGIEFLRAVPSK